MKSWKKMNVVFVFFEKTLLSVKWKVVKKNDMLEWKGVDKKIYHIENDQKKEEVFYEKMFVRIKDDRDSVTRLKSEN